MKKALLALSVAAMSVSALAAPVSQQRAAQVAESFWRNTLHAKADVELVDMSGRWQYDGIYLFANPAGGFVLVAGDDCVKPVLGYSQTSVMDVEHMPVQLTEWLEYYQLQIDAARELNAEASAADAEAWRMLEAGIPLKDDTETTVGPLLTTKWNQYAPFNEMCPGNTVTGCAATAQTQMMKYWNFPAFGKGSHSYVHRTYGRLSADFAHTLYDWDNMPDEATIVSPAVERHALATLMYHCGVSLEMVYNTAQNGGSAAAGLAGSPGFASIDNSLKDYFFYSQNMRVVNKDEGMYTDERWTDTLIAELDRGNPMVYTGSARVGGHGWVCDGYDTRRFVHFNFGWGGVGDGFYTVDSIAPGIGPAGQEGDYIFSGYNQALIGAVPDYDLRVSDSILAFNREGGVDSVLLCLNEMVSAGWSMTVSGTWIHLSSPSINRAGWVKIEVDENTTGADRVEVVTFTQGERTVSLNVVQGHYSTADLCPVTVIMQSTRGQGWRGDAHLTFESADGFVFGEARLESGSLDSTQVLVGNHDVYAVWHDGGSTDREINYYILNQYRDTLVSCVYAYRNGRTELMVWPCVPLSVDEPEFASVRVYPNPATESVTVEAEGLKAVEVTDINGRVMSMSKAATIDVSNLPKGTYFLRITTETGVAMERLLKQ